MKRSYIINKGSRPTISFTRIGVLLVLFAVSFKSYAFAALSCSNLFIEGFPAISQTRKWMSPQDLVSAEKLKHEAIKNDDVLAFDLLVKENKISLNEMSLSGHLPLVQAGFNESKNIVDYILNSPLVDLAAANKNGVSITEQLRLVGKTEMADYIEQVRPDLKSSNKIELRERSTVKAIEYPNGTPIIDFVEIPAMTYLMGEKKVLVTIDRPFEMASIDTTLKQFKEVIKLGRQHLGEKIDLFLNPAKDREKQVYDEGFIRKHPKSPDFVDGQYTPVSNISWTESTTWIRILNKLSVLNEPAVQNKLSELFPGHKLGHVYDLPTEAQYEGVLHRMGLSASDYLVSGGDSTLHKYAVYNIKNISPSENIVGSKRPIFINGKPIYDMMGLVWKWMKDSYNVNLVGGVNPLPNEAGAERVKRGGGSSEYYKYMNSYSRSSWFPDGFFNTDGFRLIRSSP